MVSVTFLSPSTRRFAACVALTALLGGAAVAPRGLAGPVRAGTAPTVAVAPPTSGLSAPEVAGVVPAALIGSDLGLREGPVAVPLQLLIPTLGVRAPVTGVGITTADVMDAPMGSADSPVWQEAFWYRGSAVPGAPSTAVLAGHVNSPRGRPAVFSHIDELRSGDPIVVHDTRTGLDVRFTVGSSETYSLREAADPSVLRRIYGVGPVAGTSPQPSADGRAHLTLITCAGTFRNGTHDRRLVVYATGDA